MMHAELIAPVRAPSRRLPLTTPSKSAAVLHHRDAAFSFVHPHEVDRHDIQLHGRHLVRSDFAQARPAYPHVRVGDIMDVDFDRRRIDCEGLFLVTGHICMGSNGKPIRWFGAHWFNYGASDGKRTMLQMSSKEYTDDGVVFVPVTPEMQIEVRGYVHNFFRAVEGSGYR